MADTAGAPSASLAAQLRADLVALDSELSEIDLLIGQARTEAGRHEQKRANAAEKLAAGRKSGADDTSEGYQQLVTLTKRAAVMEAQVEVLEGKHKALTRHRAAVAAVVERLTVGQAGLDAGPQAVDGPALADHEAAESLSPSLGRVVLSAQEDLRREIARAMHDGPAQSLTNIVLQAQIVDRLLDRDPALAKAEVRLLVSMVQHTLDATKNFIFDVRPMVLDDLGLVPTLRRSTRERGRRAHVPVEFESIGQDSRLPMDVESGTFRILDEALGAYIAQGPERMLLRLDWSDVLEARLTAFRMPLIPLSEPLPDMPTGDVPDTLRRMIQDRHDARSAAVEAAEQAAILQLPSAARRDAAERTASIGATFEILEGGAELRLVVPLPAPEGGTRS